jgi:hypothetical protein
MGVVRPFQYWTLWMSKWHKGTLYYDTTIYNSMLHDMDRVMRLLAKNMTQWKEDIYSAVKVAWQKLSKLYAEVTTTPGVLLIATLILDSSWLLWLLRKRNNAMDINPEDKTSLSIQYQEAFLKYVENKYCVKHRWMSATKPEDVQHSNFLPSATASGFGQTSSHS